MRKKSFRTLFAGLCFVLLVPLSALADVEINEQNFPNKSFRAYLLAQDYGEDGVITDEEIAGITKMDVRTKSINSLEGIQYFTALTELDCENNQLTSLDVSTCTALTTLNCWSNKLTSLNVSGCTALTDLSCNLNQLTELDVSNNAALTSLDCNGNYLRSLDVSTCTALTTLYCYRNQLMSLNVSGCTALTDLYCNLNQLTELDVSGCTALTTLNCWSNQLMNLNVSGCTALAGLGCLSNQLRSLDVSTCTALTGLSCSDNKLTNLDVSKNTALTSLNCSYNKLTSLDVTNNTALTGLDCWSNQLTSLDVSQNTALTYLNCYYNQLTSLDVTRNTALTSLQCYNNQLTSLDVSGCTALTSLNCYNNQLTELDVTQNTALTTLYCYNNQISGENMDKFIESLPNSSGVIRMYYGASDKEGNDGCTDEQVRIMRGKGWTPYYYSESRIWEPYFGDEEGLRITQQNFPDAKFREYLLEQNYGQDGVITDEEIAGITEITVFSKQISTLEGIQHFTALTELSCSSNQLTALDVSKNTALTELSCSSNQLTSLDVSQNTALIYLSCNNNKIYGEEMDKLIESLPNNRASIYIFNNYSNTEYNICTWNQADAIKAKGWNVYKVYAKYDGLTEWNVEMHEGQGEYWATLYAPFGYTLPEGTEAYVGTLNEDKQTLKMTSIGREVPRGVPVVIKGNSASVVAEVDDDITAEVGDNDLIGKYEPFDATGTDVYTLGIYEDIVGFYKDKGTKERFKAVLELSEGVEANGYRMVFEDDDITAIEDASAIVDNANAVYYDLQGRRVAEPQRGQLYIVNGKTVLYQP